MTVSLLWVLIVLVLAGIVGGWAGHCARGSALGQPATAEATTPTDYARDNLLSDLVIGVVASFSVPVFLSLARSKIFEELFGYKDVNENLLYLIGYCLIASFSAKAFIQSLSGYVFHQLQKIEGEQENLRDTVADLSEEVEKSRT